MPTVKKVTSVKAVKKAPVKAEKQVAAKLATPKVAAPKVSGMSVPVYSLLGKATGSMILPKEIFGVTVNKALLAQAMRVYTNNQKTHPGSTKTRGEVRGSTAKIYRQKGTGRARHGGIRAPIFVGGGIVFGPKPRKVTLDLPKKMKKAALVSALSSKMADKNISGVSGLEKMIGKTKEAFGMMSKINSGKSTLIIIGENQDTVVRAVRNLPKVMVLPASQINAYEVLKHHSLLITKEAISKLGETK